MRVIKVLTKRNGKRNIKSTATCGARTGTSVSHVTIRPNVKRSIRSTAI